MRLLGACLAEAGDLGVPKVFALTYVPDFFERAGFLAWTRAPCRTRYGPNASTAPSFRTAEKRQWQ